MLKKISIWLLVMILAVFSQTLLIRRTRASIRTHEFNGTATLTYAPIGWFLVWLLWGLETLVLWAAIFAKSVPGQEGCGFMFAGVVALGGVIMTAVVAGQKIKVDSKGIDRWVIWRGRKFFQWQSFKSISVHQKSRWFLFTTQGGEKLRITYDSKGLSNFADCCIKFLPEHVKASSPEAIDLFKRLTGAA